MRKIVLIIMAVALIALPTMAQEDQWQSTSTMKGTGSNYAPQVTAVGATSVQSMASTIESSPAPQGGPNKAKKFDTGGDAGQGPSPLGDSVLPLLLMSLAFAGVIYSRKRHARV
ncbi:MAG: hypothetical protein II692_02595 [Paludibacteraceae bacterium]|nr:hypothetical protein [Paludibacteraceae bacterium]